MALIIMTLTMTTLGVLTLIIMILTLTTFRMMKQTNLGEKHISTERRFAECHYP
jgi:hypothetical protein